MLKLGKKAADPDGPWNKAQKSGIVVRHGDCWVRCRPEWAIDDLPSNADEVDYLLKGHHIYFDDGKLIVDKGPKTVEEKSGGGSRLVLDKQKHYEYLTEAQKNKLVDPSRTGRLPNSWIESLKEVTEDESPDQTYEYFRTIDELPAAVSHLDDNPHVISTHEEVISLVELFHADYDSVPVAKKREYREALVRKIAAGELKAMIRGVETALELNCDVAEFLKYSEVPCVNAASTKVDTGRTRKESITRKEYLTSGGETSIEIAGKKFTDVLYDLDSDRISSDYYERLDNLAEELVSGSLKDRKIIIRGHACELGSEEHNTELSKRRVESILFYLMNRGVKRDQIVPEYYGEAKSAGGDLPEDRRVEFSMFEGEFETLEPTLNTSFIPGSSEFMGPLFPELLKKQGEGFVNYFSRNPGSKAKIRIDSFAGLMIADARTKAIMDYLIKEYPSLEGKFDIDYNSGEGLHTESITEENSTVQLVDFVEEKVEVTEAGKTVRETRETLNPTGWVHFSPEDMDKFDSEADKLLVDKYAESFINLIDEYPNMVIRLDSFCSDTASHEYNYELAARRTATVRNRMVAFFTAKGRTDLIAKFDDAYNNSREHGIHGETGLDSRLNLETHGVNASGPIAGNRKNNYSIL